jgi:PPK2 family polyphosphate:nucleotide phosphotransferase
MRSPDDLVVKPGKEIRLAERDPASKLGFADKEAGKAALAADVAEIDRLQEILFAERKRALLVVLQGTDTSGKDGTIRDVFDSADPQGMRVTAFGRPSEEELAHDFLWRIHAACPRRGMIGVFNRSHYEDVLVVKVKKLAPENAVAARYEQINAFEKILTENGTTVVKFMLHISKDEQRERLQARLDEPDKRWKFNPADLDDRARWDDFQAAYETMLDRCSTPWAPWHVIPSDRKWVRSAAIAAIVRRTLADMNLRYPESDYDPSAIRIV